MSEVAPVYCFNFSVQLIFCEFLFLIGRKRQQNWPRRVLASLLLYTALAAAWYSMLHTIPGYRADISILYYLGLFAFTIPGIRLSYDLSWAEIVFVATGGYAVEHIIYSVVKIFRYLTGINADLLGTLWNRILFGYLSYVVIGLLIYRLMIYRNRDKEEFRREDRRMVSLSLAVMMSAIVFSCFYTIDTWYNGNSLINDVIGPAGSLLCCILVLQMEYSIFRDNRAQREKEMMDQLLQMAASQQKSSREAIDIINMKCHDMKHQLRMLSSMNDTAQQSEYYDELREALTIYDATCHTGCEALDYLLREKMLIAAELGAQFSVIADGADLNRMEAADLYALMGNALDNAIESVRIEPQEQRTISLNIRRFGRMVSIHLENRCSRELTFEDGLPQTDKEDRSQHGFGVQSIRHIVRKYGGELQMKEAGGMFSLDILLPLSEPDALSR